MPVLKKPKKISKRTPRNQKAHSVSPREVRVYRFGVFTLDQAERVLHHEGEQIALTPKVFDILSLLVSNAGRLVTKESLLETVWPDSFVEEANLSVNVAMLRKALGEETGKHQYIDTVSKHGYRFVAGVEEVSRREEIPDSPANRVKPIERRDRPERIPISLAVLPFQNETGDPNAEYLSHGLTESIINSTSQSQRLRVVARNTVFRYRANQVNPQQVGRELGVSSVLSGRILQLGDRLIVRTELTDVFNGWQIWGDQYHAQLADILAVQGKISAAISRKLKVKLTREEKERLGRRHTEDAEAFRLYLKGRYHWNKYTESGLKQAIDYFEQAIEIDPTYALAYAGLADTYYRLSNMCLPTREAMPKAKAAAIKALLIDPSLSEAHAALGLITLFYEWDWSGAADEFSRAIEADPNNALAHQRLGLYFSLRGHFDDAVYQIKLAMALDPLSPQINLSLAVSFFLARRYQPAIEEVRNTLEMDNSFAIALFMMGRIYEQLGQYAESIATFKKALSLNDTPYFRAGLAHAYAMSGRPEAARNLLSDLEEESHKRYVSSYYKAIINLALGDKDRTFTCLELAFEAHCEMMLWIKEDPFFDCLRDDRRFAILLRRVGLDQDYQASPAAVGL